MGETLAQSLGTASSPRLRLLRRRLASLRFGRVVFTNKRQLSAKSLVLLARKWLQRPTLWGSDYSM